MSIESEAMMAEARAAILAGDSQPIRVFNTRAREHAITLRDGKTIHVIYDRTAGEVTKLLYPTGDENHWK